jgi:CRP-like cAMP-binding protein
MERRTIWLIHQDAWMASFQQSPNTILASLPSSDFDLLRPFLRTIEMPVDSIWVNAGEIPARALFPHSGLISSRITLSTGEVVDVRLTGREGALDAAIGACERASVTSTVVRIGGRSSAIDLPKLQSVIDRSIALRAALARFDDARQAESDRSLACLSSHNAEARLARLLLRLCRIMGATRFDLTQEALAEMLGIRRNAVSFVAHAMQKAGVIRYVRGSLEIIDAGALYAQSCECHDEVQAHARQTISGKAFGNDTYPE